VSYKRAPIRLSTERKGRERREPVWFARYRIANEDSTKVLGKAWTKRSRAPAGISRAAKPRTPSGRFWQPREQGIFALGVERYDIPEDASLALTRAKTRRSTSDKISFYPPEEVMRLVKHARDEQDAALLLTAAFTGLRASELCALRWRSVDFASSLIHVERGFTDEGGEDVPKSYRVRSVPLMPQVALELTKLRRRELFTHDDDDLVFARPTGKVLNYDSLVVRYKAAQKAADLRPLRFHDVRHSFGTMAVRQFPITDVQTWMGHADIATTRKYIHYAPQPEAAARPGSLVAEQLADVSPLRATTYRA
jgi:integrase